MELPDCTCCTGKGLAGDNELAGWLGTKVLDVEGGLIRLAIDGDVLALGGGFIGDTCIGVEGFVIGTDLGATIVDDRIGS